MPKNESEFDRDVERMVNELQDTLDSIPETVPFNAVKLDADEKLARYREMRDDREAWRKLLAEKDFPSVLEYGEQMERLHLEENEHGESTV